MYYTYVLLSKKDMQFYIGYTCNIKQRFKLHTQGLVDSTKDRRPLELIYYEACKDRNDDTTMESR